MQKRKKGRTKRPYERYPVLQHGLAFSTELPV
jgi:hypothetical protein